MAYPTICRNSACQERDDSESGCRRHGVHGVSALCLEFTSCPDCGAVGQDVVCARCERLTHLSLTRCFGIGCPLRSDCARFRVRGKKLFSFIEEQFSFILGKCANFIEREAVEVADGEE